MLVLAFLSFAFGLVMGILSKALPTTAFVKDFDSASCFVLAGNMLLLGVFLSMTLGVKTYYSGPNRLAVRAACSCLLVTLCCGRGSARCLPWPSAGPSCR